MDYDMNIDRITIQHYLDCETLTSPLQVVHSGKDDKDFADIIPDASAAFLGPNLWTGSKQDYIGLELFEPSPEEGQEMPEVILDQNSKSRAHDTSNMHLSGLHSTCQRSSQVSSPLDTGSLKDFSDVDDSSRTFSVECKFSPSDLALATPPGHKHYDPASTVFPEDELKPQPIIKKSRKNFVPDNMKDDKYWARRQKNNIAAKRSREARRLKENQIVLRASYLEKENSSLKEDVMRLKAENDMLKSQLKEYQT